MERVVLQDKKNQDLQSQLEEKAVAATTVTASNRNSTRRRTGLSVLMFLLWSVQLQAYWRGTMVRRGLGPYKKVEEKKGKKKKGKKKKWLFFFHRHVCKLSKKIYKKLDKNM